MSEPLAVDVRNLTKVFQTMGDTANTFRKSRATGESYVVAVDNLSLQIKPGEVYGLIGPNGSGKSTAMKVVLGLMSPTKGTAKVFGVDSQDGRARQDVGFLPENPYFYRHLSGQETLRFYGRLCGIKGSTLNDRIDELLKMVGLEDARKRRLSGYSKGMLQRIGLAQALIQSPRLVVLDEPTAGVDPLGSRQIRDLIFQLKEEGISVFFCSHLLEQVQEVCDNVGIIFEGRMRKEGVLEDLISDENRQSIVLENASSDLIGEIEELVKKDSNAKVVESGHPKTTLERLFINIARQAKKARK